MRPFSLPKGHGGLLWTKDPLFLDSPSQRHPVRCNVRREIRGGRPLLPWRWGGTDRQTDRRTDRQGAGALGWHWAQGSRTESQASGRPRVDQGAGTGGLGAGTGRSTSRRALGGRCATEGAGSGCCLEAEARRGCPGALPRPRPRSVVGFGLSGSACPAENDPTSLGARLGHASALRLSPGTAANMKDSGDSKNQQLMVRPSVSSAPLA